MSPKDNEQEHEKRQAQSDAKRRDAPNVQITAHWLDDPATQTVFQTLNTKDVETRAVGGAVRNALLGLPATDIDFATTASPEDVSTLASAAGMRVHPTGLDHGTVTLVINGKPFEVTTLRKDVSTDGRRATVAFTKDWTEDANRRDFTMNALYCDAEGNLFDPVGGYDDLTAQKVRFIGEPRLRIREDFLRILRFFRFCAAFGTSPIDPEGLKACVEEKKGLTTLSGERVQAEILRLLAEKIAAPAIRTMNDTGILEIALATKPNLRAFERLSAIEDHLDIKPDPIRRLAALAVQGPRDITALVKHLKLSNSQARRLKQSSPDTHDRKSDVQYVAESDERAQRKALYCLGPQAYEDTCLLQWAHAQVDLHDTQHKNAFLIAEKWEAPELPYSGADLIARGLTPGPSIGHILSQFETWWIDEDFPQSRELLEKKLDELVRAQ